MAGLTASRNMDGARVLDLMTNHITPASRCCWPIGVAEQEIDAGVVQKSAYAVLLLWPLGAHVVPTRRQRQTWGQSGDLASQSSSYIDSSRSAYFCSTARRRIFWFGVTSPSSTVNSAGRISNRLIVSQRSNFWLAVVT
jgi:hypothetical protein